MEENSGCTGTSTRAALTLGDELIYFIGILCLRRRQTQGELGGTGKAPLGGRWASLTEHWGTARLARLGEELGRCWESAGPVLGAVLRADYWGGTWQELGPELGEALGSVLETSWLPHWL
jgi:hypothetical protein